MQKERESGGQGTCAETKAEQKGSLALAEVGTAQMRELGDMKVQCQNLKPS